MNNLLVTGGAGFIGSNFVKYWLSQYPKNKIVVLDALTYAGNLENLEEDLNNPQLTFVEGNICNQALVETLLQTHQINTLVHFAAESHVDRSISGPDEFIQTNILGTYSLLKAAKVVWLDQETPIQHRFHHVSTDEVYGSLASDEPAFAEDHPYAPNSPYSASKAASDHLVRAYHHTYGLQVTTSNCSNNYGPYHFPEKLIPLVIINILHNKNLPIYGDGQQIRDWLYVEDHAYGIDLVLQNGKVGECYNIGGHNEWANIDIVELVCSLIEEEFEQHPELINKFPLAKAASQKQTETLVEYVTDRLGHDRRYAIDATKSKNDIGYQPKESFETGIRKTIQWYLHNENWWKSVLSQHD